jgi:hypothetical protein
MPVKPNAAGLWRPRAGRALKCAFEIGIIGKSANVNSFHAPQGSRHFARARPAIRRRTLLSYGSVGAGRKRS